MQLNRLFFALWPDAAVEAAALEAARELRVRMQPGGHLTRPGMLHVTLSFLGNTVSAEQEAAAQQCAARVRAEPFTLALEQAGSFRGAKFPWWLGPREAPPALLALHHQLHELLLRARVAPEREKFAPHLTVLRDAAMFLPPTPIRPIEWQVREFVLMRSRMDLQPAVYEELGRWPLIADAAGRAADQLGLWDSA
ncbi:MAG TPA: RNA 2',3'-cyclic phosphodiesterase [Solimonas sp.]|nr:RNA 2',3'-cyclic phosphodiesterase [Solimonas sp.]